MRILGVHIYKNELTLTGSELKVDRNLDKVHLCFLLATCNLEPLGSATLASTKHAMGLHGRVYNIHARMEHNEIIDKLINHMRGRKFCRGNRPGQQNRPCFVPCYIYVIILVMSSRTYSLASDRPDITSVH